MFLRPNTLGRAQRRYVCVDTNKLQNILVKIDLLSCFAHLLKMKLCAKRAVFTNPVTLYMHKNNNGNNHQKTTKDGVKVFDC